VNIELGPALETNQAVGKLSAAAIRQPIV